MTSARTTLAFATAATGYLTYRCLKPPTPPKPDGSVRDSISFKNAYTLLRLYRVGLTALAFLQSYLILDPENFNALLSRLGPPPNPSPELNAALLTWSPASAIALPVLAAAALLRLHAMRALGSRFTFELRNPDALCTTGVYAWVQHPSYSSGLVVFALSAAWFARADGVLGALLLRAGPLGRRVVEHARLHNAVGAAVMCAALGAGASVRMRDEERMLKAKFGRQWEEWSARTARLVPWVY